MVYAALFSWAWLATLLADNVRSVRRIAGLAVALVLLAFAALRGYSTDYDGYVEIYDVMVAIDIPYPERLYLAKDALFSLMIDLILWLRGGPQYMFVLMALLAVLVKQRVYTLVFHGNTAAAWAVTLSLYFFLHEFTQSRVAIAIAMCFLATIAALQGRRLAWFLWTWVGIGFHLSALLFLPLSAVLLLPPERRTWGFVVVITGVCLVGISIFELLGTVDLRVAEYRELTGANRLALVVAAVKLGMLLLMARLLQRAPVSRASQALVGPSVMFVTGGFILLLAFQIISSALAFRFYEFLDAFSVFIVTAALLQRRPVPVLMALSYCALGIMLQYLPELFTRYEIAPWSSYVQ
jgi:hypothetical protein